MGKVNFTACAAAWANVTPAVRHELGWHGQVVNIPPDDFSQISLHGCIVRCGAGSAWYEWDQVSNTITTWVLPIVGILLQAPFVSNAFWETTFSLARWLGSPMASLTYILWNIKVSGKCALLVDLAVPYDKEIFSRDTDFGKIRDSFYLLMTMNQFTIRPRVQQKKEAEGLLRVALFSKDLRLLKRGITPEGIAPRASFDDHPQSVEEWRYNVTRDTPSPVLAIRNEDDLEPAGRLDEMRQELAQSMRLGRKRGVVPVFISTLWFLFALALSIQSAFGFIGVNAQAHDLALGCLLCWLPCLILSSIVDRNPVAADDIRDKLNNLVERTRLSLMDDTVRNKFIECIRHPTQEAEMRARVETISRACPDLEKFFVHFAGQARLRFHYGAAHPILSDIEWAYIANEGRDWLASEEEARRKLVLGKPEGLDWLDPRELWQVLSAVVIAGGSIMGAFIISFFTPTVGLGCRSGGYTIFGSIAFGLLLVEILSWWILDASKPRLETLRHDLRRMTTQYAEGTRFMLWYLRFREASDEGARTTILVLRRFLQTTVAKVSSPAMATAADKQLKTAWTWALDLTAQQRLDYFFFKPVECVNSAWLIYITMAQTTGAYRNCHCMSSTWGGGGGYIDWNNYATSHYVKIYWIVGAALSSTVMAVAMSYIMIEWCLQSHLSTADFHAAARGLQMTRRFRYLTNPFRITMHLIIETAYTARLLVFNILRRSKVTDSSNPVPRESRRSVRWTRNPTCHNPDHDHKRLGRPMTDLPPFTSRSRGESELPLIEGRDADGLPIIVVNADEQPHKRDYDSDTPSPRTSYEPTTRAESVYQQNLHVPDRRPGYERQGTGGSSEVGGERDLRLGSG